MRCRIATRSENPSCEYRVVAPVAPRGSACPLGGGKKPSVIKVGDRVRIVGCLPGDPCRTDKFLITLRDDACGAEICEFTVQNSAANGNPPDCRDNKVNFVFAQC